MQGQKEAPPDMECKDKFLLQSAKANDGMTAKDITAEMVHEGLPHKMQCVECLKSTKKKGEENWNRELIRDSKRGREEPTSLI